MGDMDISGEKREQIIRAAMKNFFKKWLQENGDG